MDAKNTAVAEDVYEFKSVKDTDSSPDQKGADALHLDADATDPLSITAPPAEDAAAKRNISELTDPLEENPGNDEESRRKKRKDETAKEGKSTAQRNAGQTKGQGGKQSGGSQNKSGTLSSNKASGDKKSPCSSPKPPAPDAETDDGKTDLKVPPLKIVIPQTTSSEQELGVGRNGKNSSQRTHQALPYVVASSNSAEPNEKETAAGSTSPETSSTAKGEDKKDSTNSGPLEERGGSSHQRVLRSSHRSGTTQATDRGSNNSSPQLQRSHSPSPSSSPAAQPQNQADPPTSSAAQTNATSKSSDSQAQQNNDTETTTSSSSSTATVSTPAPVELHPRKRKMKQNKEQSAPQPEPPEVPPEAQVHPHEQPITNCYQLFLNIRNQINKRRRGLFPVQPKPPQGFKDYLMNRCTYVLAGTAPTTPNITYPQTLPSQMKDLFTEQEKERYRLRTQHVIEKEKLVLSVEQEILRVHGKAARALANQSLPFSVCTILRDEEVYNLITPEQEEKDRNARSRYNGRLFLSWLQDVDDKWEKIKEHMLLRHHNEAESLHAVQKMNWEWKMKELNLCDRKTTPKIDETHVPMVHVSDDFDLLPA
ncbi:ankyrin repeat domain-containing protein 11 [Anoplophora glabripennis]|nr:ankyrin repeat domain-containing protein 11 [Anoplophora glabripennis]